MLNNELRIYHFDDDSEILKGTRKACEMFFEKNFPDIKLEWKSGDNLKDVENIEFDKNDILILDLSFADNEKHNKKGEDVYKVIKDKKFVPIIFYSGHTNKLSLLEENNAFVVNKGMGVKKLLEVLKALITSKIPFLKQNMYEIIEQKFKEYFWKILDENSEIINNKEDSVQLGYSIYRNIGTILTSDSIREILMLDSSIENGKVHPLQMYIYPIEKENSIFEIGEIVSFKEKTYIVLTPSCDFIQRPKRELKVKNVFLLECTEINELNEYAKYIEEVGKENANKKTINEAKNRLMNILKPMQGSQFYYLPKAYFMQNDLVVDFQKKLSIDINEFKQSVIKIAKLDSPFVESLVNKYLDYYGRIGTPDLDYEYLLDKHLK